MPDQVGAPPPERQVRVADEVAVLMVIESASRQLLMMGVGSDGVGLGGRMQMMMETSRSGVRPTDAELIELAACIVRVIVDRGAFSGPPLPYV